MDWFVATENVKRFKKLLGDCTDERERETIELLLAEEEAHLAALVAPGRQPAPIPSGIEPRV